MGILVQKTRDNIDIRIIIYDSMDYLKVNKKTYNVLAPEYEVKVEKRKNFNDFVISKFTKFIATGDKVLDLGCAVGLDMDIFRSKGFSVVGIDISEKMVRLAQKRNPDTKILQGDFMDISFNEQFDAIFAQAFIHLFPKSDISAVFNKMRKLLKSQGVAHVTTSKSKESKEGWFIKSDYQGEHKRFRKHWTKEELKETLKENNFQILNYYEIKDPFSKEWMVFTIQK